MTAIVFRLGADMSKLSLVLKVRAYDNPPNKDGSIRYKIIAYHKGMTVGFLDYNIKLKDNLNIHVRDEYRRKGIATALYDKAKELGANIDGSNKRTGDGQAFRDAYDKRSENQDG